jgi:hypothetical protein
VYALLAGVYTTTSGVVLGTLFVIPLAWTIISLGVGPAALRSTNQRH